MSTPDVDVVTLTHQPFHISNKMSHSVLHLERLMLGVTLLPSLTDDVAMGVQLCF
jgi:hypothetical protein